MLALQIIPEAFTAVECAQLAAIAHAAPARDAGLVGRTRDHNLRRAELVWLDDVADTGWVMDRIIDLVRVANREVFDFDLQEFSESPQLARYGADRQGHFGWHSDIGDGRFAVRRKLTLVTQLSDPGAYAGGQLEVWIDSHVRSAPLELGTAVFFPSFALHRVQPVTEGERISLTTWAHGPAFR